MVQKQNQKNSTSTGSKLIHMGPVKIRLSRIIFGVVMIITTFALIWPGFSLYSSATPLVFGFPLSFAWIILWVIIGFFAMFGLYLSDSKIEETD